MDYYEYDVSSDSSDTSSQSDYTSSLEECDCCAYIDDPLCNCNCHFDVERHNTIK